MPDLDVLTKGPGNESSHNMPLRGYTQDDDASIRVARRTRLTNTSVAPRAALRIIDRINEVLLPAIANAINNDPILYEYFSRFTIKTNAELVSGLKGDERRRKLKWLSSLAIKIQKGTVKMKTVTVEKNGTDWIWIYREDAERIEAKREEVRKRPGRQRIIDVIRGRAANGAGCRKDRS